MQFYYWDLKAYYLPGFWLGVLITLGFLFHISFGLIDSFLGFLVGGGLLFFFIYWVRLSIKEVMGTGDILSGSGDRRLLGRRYCVDEFILWYFDRRFLGVTGFNV